MELLKSIISMNNLFDSGDAIKDLMFLIEFCSAIVLLLIIGYSIYRDRKIKDNQKQRFYLYAIIIDIAVSIISDVIINYIKYPLQFGFFSVRLSTYILYAANFMATWFVIHFIYELLNERNAKPSKHWIYLINVTAVLDLLNIFSNYFTERIFYFDNKNEYYRGDMFLTTMIGPGIALLVIVLMLITYRKYLLSSELLVVIIYVALPLAAQGVQIFIYNFSWLQLAMTFSAFMILAEHYIGKFDGKNFKHTEIAKEGRDVQRKMIIVVCFVIIIFFAFTSKIAISFASRQMNQETLAHYKVEAEKINKELSSWLDRDAQILLDQRASIEVMDNYDKDYLSKYFETIIDKYYSGDYIYDLYFISSNNDVISGRNYVPMENMDYTQKSFYQNALKSDDICFSIPYKDEFLNKYVITLSIKVMDKNGNTTGVLALDLWADSMFNFIVSQELPEDSYLFVVDNNLGVDTHKNIAFGYENDSPRRLGTLSEEYAELEKHLLSENYKDNSISLVDYDGATRLFFVSKNPTCNWYIIVAISEDIIGIAEQELGESIFISLMICLIIGVALTLWGSNNLVLQLTTAQEEAYAANEAKSRFLANMSHEIRTPINAVLGMDEIILQETKDENIKEYADNIKSAGQSLLSLVNDILDFSKIESGKLDIIPTEYDTAELVKSCVNLMKIRIEEKNLKFELKQGKYVPKRLFGDDSRVRQIISNLMSNAVKYTPSGKITLTIDWESKSDKEGNLIVMVHDTGIGIKPENMQDLFTSFKRLDEKKNRTIEGTGLGLVITKQLAELIGGDITVISEYGNGSTFTATISQTVIDSANSENFLNNTATANNDKLINFTAPELNALIVDDVKMNIKVVQGLLKNTKISIDTAESGFEAIEHIKNKKYDIIFLDHMMPEMDGVETFAKLKAEHPDKIENIPVIMLTANAVLGASEEYIKEGFTSYLSKPVSKQAIYDCILKYAPQEKIVI